MLSRDFPLPILRNKDRCQHLSLHMDCHVGGPATADCFHPSFHNKCPFKLGAEKKITNEDAEVIEALEKE